MKVQLRDEAEGEDLPAMRVTSETEVTGTHMCAPQRLMGE